MDMIGLTFEGFDSIGQERSTERGVELDLSGEVLGVEVYGPQELSILLSEHERLGSCLAKRIFRYARAQHESDQEEILIEELVTPLQGDLLTIKSLLKAITLSEGFHGPYTESEVQDWVKRSKMRVSSLVNALMSAENLVSVYLHLLQNDRLIDAPRWGGYLGVLLWA